jgi:hypothetical protein
LIKGSSLVTSPVSKFLIENGNSLYTSSLVLKLDLMEWNLMYVGESLTALNDSKLYSLMLLIFRFFIFKVSYLLLSSILIIRYSSKLSSIVWWFDLLLFNFFPLDLVDGCLAPLRVFVSWCIPNWPVLAD